MIQNLKSEPAVSPVIGTILLVAIAVILVAIILAAVMGFSGDPNEKKVGLNAQPVSTSGADANLLLYGGASIPELVKLEMIDQGSPIGEYVEVWNVSSGNANVGVPYTAKNVARPLKDMDTYDTRINVKGTFSDGTDVVLLIQPMEFGNVFGPSEITKYIAGIRYQGRDDILENYRRWTDVNEGDRGYLGKSLTSGLIEIKFVDPLPEGFGDVLIRIESITPGKENAEPIARLGGGTSLTHPYDTGNEWNAAGPGIVDSGVPGDGQWLLTLTVRAGSTSITEYWYLY